MSSPSSTYSTLSDGQQILIRHLSSKDIPRIREMHVRTVLMFDPFDRTNDHPQNSILGLNLPNSFYQQLLFHPTRLCLVAVPFSSSPSLHHTVENHGEPVAFISAALHNPTNDLSISLRSSTTTLKSRRSASEDAVEMHVLTIGVSPAFRRQHLATRLLKEAVRAIQTQARVAAQTPVIAQCSLDNIVEEDEDAESEIWGKEMKVTVHLPVADEEGRKFWEGIGLTEQGEVKLPNARAGPWRESMRVTGRVAA